MRHVQSLAAIAATALLCATSCSIKENRIDCLAPVHVKVSNDFTVTQEDFPTKAVEPVSTNASVKSYNISIFCK